VKPRIVVLGAGFGGLEFSAMLSEAMGDALDLTLIDRSDSFFFGFSKLDVMFGRVAPDSVRIPYREIAKPGVHFRQETITKIDPDKRRVNTNRQFYEADVLVVALGADYDQAATPGLVEGGNEFYSFRGAERLREVLPTFTKGRAIVGVTSVPFKCPPAPSEASLLLHEYLTKRGVRGACEISLVMPFLTPIPPSPSTSKALLAAFAERGINFVPGRVVRSLNLSRHVAVLDNSNEMPYDLFLGIPKHRVPDVVSNSGLTENGWIPVNPKNLVTKFPGVYAFGDVTGMAVPKAGVFAEGEARVAARSVIVDLKGGTSPPPYDGKASCYIEFGSGLAGRADMDFLSGPSPWGTFVEPSTGIIAEKSEFASSRHDRWFGR
jgi:sulfide:quinone oxidoreductase